MRDFSRGFRPGVDVNLGVGYVNETTIPRRAIAAAFEAVSAESERSPHTFNYGESRGSANLVSALQRFLIRHQIGGLTESLLTEREIIIGANGATSLLDALAHVLPRGVVVTTEPQYYIYCDYLRRLGFSIVAVPEDEEGVDIAALERVLSENEDELSFVYIVTVGNPSAVILSNRRRGELVRAVSRTSRRINRKIPLVLDQAYEWLLHAAEQHLESGALSDELGLVYEIGTLAKVLAPTLRIGFLLGPPGPLTTALIQRTNDVGFSAPLLNQEAAAYLLDNAVDTHLHTVRAGYRHKARVVTTALQRELGPHLERSVGGRAGFYYYLTLRGIPTTEGSPFYQHCARSTGDRDVDLDREAPEGTADGAAAFVNLAPRVVYLPGQFCVDSLGTQAALATRQMRLSFGFADDAELERGVRLLGEAARYAAAYDARVPAAIYEPKWLHLIERLLVSYRTATGRELVSGATLRERVEQLFHAPLVALSHDAEAEPNYNFGNALALRLFEMDWEELTTMPSKRCAEPSHREERLAFLAQVEQRGFAEGYSGVRISKGGRRFRIEGVACWNIFDHDGRRMGQAACCPRWTYL